MSLISQPCVFHRLQSSYSVVLACRIFQRKLQTTVLYLSRVKRQARACTRLLISEITLINTRNHRFYNLSTLRVCYRLSSLFVHISCQNAQRKSEFLGFVFSLHLKKLAKICFYPLCETFRPNCNTLFLPTQLYPLKIIVFVV